MSLATEPPNVRLRRLRSERGLSEDQVAERANMSSFEYFDLEAYEDEIGSTLSAAKLLALCATLEVGPSELLTGKSFAGASKSSFETLRAAVHNELQRSGQALPAFEERVGWEVGGALQSASHFRSFSYDGLRDVASAVGMDALAVLEGELTL